jgi:hypothetical protein
MKEEGKEVNKIGKNPDPVQALFSNESVPDYTSESKDQFNILSYS